MTTLIHPNAQPVVYAHRVEFVPHVGNVTPANWRRAFRELVCEFDRALHRKEPSAVAMVRELISWEEDNAEAIEREIAAQAVKDAKPPRPYTPPMQRVRPLREPRAAIACRICSSLFTPESKIHIYCSPQCRSKANPSKTRTVGNGRKSRQKVKSCPMCQAEVTKYRATYCAECIKKRKRAHEAKRKIARRQEALPL